jgi:hypothetical protein
VCLNCGEQRFCFTCDQGLHKGPLARQHPSRIPFPDYIAEKKEKEKQQQQEEKKREIKLSKDTPPPTKCDSDSELEVQTYHSFLPVSQVQQELANPQDFLKSFLYQAQSSTGEDSTTSNCPPPDFFRSFADYSRKCEFFCINSEYI